MRGIIRRASRSFAAKRIDPRGSSVYVLNRPISSSNSKKQTLPWVLTDIPSKTNLFLLRISVKTHGKVRFFGIRVKLVTFHYYELEKGRKRCQKQEPRNP